MPQSTPVIVGVDGSERSADALALADVLAPALGCPVVIAFVHPYGKLSSFYAEGEYEQLVPEVGEANHDRVREHLPSIGKRRIQVVAEASPAAGLHALAERESAALIVIGSSHQSPVGRILPGGTGERLLSGANVPVTVAPAAYAAADPRLQAVGCGFDGSPEAYRALDWAAALARTASAQLRVVAVYEATLHASLAVGGGPATSSVNEVLRRQLLAELAQGVSALGAALDVSAELVDGSAADALKRESREVDLLVVGSRGYGPLRAVILGSVSRALVRSAESPLVVVPRAADALDG